MHEAGGAIWTPIFCEGATELMMKGNGWGTNHDGLFITSMLDAHSAWWHRADELSETLKLGMLMGHYGTKHYRGRYYAKARNLARGLRAAYDKVLDECDLLLMPTTQMAASKLPPPGAAREEIVERAFEMVGNTAPFDATGHPAISVPCGMTPDKRPVGMMLIARHWDEMAIYRAADAFERAGDWRRM